MDKKKKGQSGINAAVLVAIIAGIIILYIIFISPEQREEILTGENGNGGGISNSNNNITLLSESVGTLEEFKDLEDRSIPNIYLIETTDSTELDSINPVSVRNGWFDKKIKIVNFYINDLENTDNVVLTFTAPKRKGILTIKLNENSIFEYDINSLNVDPISLEKELLGEENILEFSVSGVGMAFWKTNEYNLENIKVIGDITDKSRQESRNIFSLTTAEYMNLDSVSLKFVPYCSKAIEVGILDVYINNKNVYHSVPICDDLVKQDIPVSILNAGENKIIFKTEKGSYSVEQIKVELDPKEDEAYVLHYFEINSTTYDEILDDDEDVYLRIEFVDEDSDKKAELNVNGHFYYINIDKEDEEKIFERNINAYIEEGSNFVKITPKTKLEIVKVEVLVIED